MPATGMEPCQISALVFVLALLPLVAGFNISYPATSPHQVLLPADVRQPDTVLNCELAHNGNDSDISWVWLQDEVVLPDSNSTGSSTIIVIFNDEPETAEGLYSCVATLPDGNTTSADIQLTLEVKLYSPLLKIEEIETSASFNITCSQYGYARDPTEVHFHKDGVRLDSDQDSRYEVLTVTEAQQGRVNISTILMVQDARVNDSGIYTCSLQGAEDVNITVDVLPDCGAPGTPANSAVQLSAKNQIATFSCGPGYQLEGNSTHICQQSGEWSGHLPSCTLLDCGEPQPLPNGSVSFNSTVYGSKATYSCAEGYELTAGNPLMQCQADGEWSGAVPRCELVDCGVPESPANGSVHVSSTMLGSVATYNCSMGYSHHGNMTARCLASGQWSGAAPTCSLVDCRSPESADNRVAVVTSTTFGSTVLYSCEKGYTLQGSNNSQCQASGRWTEEPSCTLVDCGTPEMPFNGAIDFRSTTFDSTVQYACNTGYSLVGQNTSVCQADGEWSSGPPSCEVVDCGDLAVVANGNHNLTGTTFGFTVSYECMDGYRLVGVAERVCQENGAWSGEAPSCHIITPSPTAVVTMATGSTTKFSPEASLTTIFTGVESFTSTGTVPTPTPSSESGPRAYSQIIIDPFFVIVGLSAGGGVLLLLAVLCCFCIVCTTCRRVRKRQIATALDRTSQATSVRRPSLMERKTSLFMDDTDYVIRTGIGEGGKVSQGSLRGRIESISEDNLDVPLGQIEETVEETPDGLEEVESAEHTQQKEHTMTGFSSPSTSEVEMQSSKVGPSVPTHAATSNRFSYASQGPSSTPQHYGSDSLASSSDKQTAGTGASHQESPLLSRQHGAGWPLLLADRAASNVSIHLGGNIQFDSERFEQCIGTERHTLSEGNYHLSAPASAEMHQGIRTSPTSYSYTANGNAYQDDTESVEDERVSKMSLASSVAAVQGDSLCSDPRSYTPSSVVSSSVGAGYTHRIVDDASESDVEIHQQCPTADRSMEEVRSPQHMMRRIQSDVQMRKVASDPEGAVFPSLKHTSSAGPDRFEIMKRKGEKRKSYKDFHGYPSINEWFEDIWVANTNSQQLKEEEVEPKGRATTLT